MLRYHCKFSWDTTFRYGIVQEYAGDAKELTSRGLVCVTCAIANQDYEVPVLAVQDIAHVYGRFHPETGVFWGGNEVDDFVALCQLYSRIVEAKLPAGKFCAGRQFAVGVADGSANYVVTKVHRVNCVIAWRAWGADRYFDHHFLGGGTFPIADIKRYVHLGSKVFGANDEPDKLEQIYEDLTQDWEQRFGPLPVSEFLPRKAAAAV